MFENGANEITIEDIENFLNGEGAETPAAENEENSPATQPDQSDEPAKVDTPQVTETQAFARRLKEEKQKARNEERENIAKQLGYESYADLQQKRQAQLFEEKGLDPEDVSPIVEQLVAERIANDPRLRELDNYRQERVNEWAQKELAELKELTGGKVTKLSDVPNDVIELWKTKGSLKAAYIELNGEKLIREMQTGIASGQNRSTTSHMASPHAASAPTGDGKKRPFTEEERKVYKLFNPGVTDEQLSKMYKEI